MRRVLVALGVALVFVVAGWWVLTIARSEAVIGRAGMALEDDPAAIRDVQSRVKSGKPVRLPRGRRMEAPPHPGQGSNAAHYEPLPEGE